jgi:succinoglycan biosynthesis protein ExoM
MNNIVICIPSYQRALLLKKLVISILDCNIKKSLIRDINIIIVDNDANKSAEEIVSELKKDLSAPYSLYYFNYPIKGLTNVRNELIKNALLLKPDFIVFIDDDEYVTSEWLNELVETIIVNNGDLAMGPVITVIDNNGSDNISCWLQRQNYLNNSKLDFIRTGNLIINVKSLLNFKIWFDQRFNFTGGEDSYFGIQMIKKGANIYWAANAIVYETIPKNRANIKWLIKRYYNGANIYTYTLKIEKQYLKLFKKIFVSLIYLIAGISAFVIIPIPIRRKYWGMLKFSEGIGGIAGLFSINYNEYK